MGSPPWTEGRVQTLRQLWPEESSSTIAKLLGTTRNAVIGMAHRLHLPSKAPNGRATTKSHNPRKPRKPRLKAEPPPPHATSDPIPLIEAKASHCRAIVDHQYDENGLAMICGKPIVAGQSFSFCSEHLERFTTKGYYYDRGRRINK